MKWGTIVAVALLCAVPDNASASAVSHHSLALDFDYSWPSSAARIPPLNRNFVQQAKMFYGETLGYASDDQQAARDGKRPFNRHFYVMKWSAVGESPRLLSLIGSFSSYSGGAHPNSGKNVLLWDRKIAGQITFDSLLAHPSGYKALPRSEYCRRLDAERAKRRQGQKLGGEFDKCPKFIDLRIAPADKNGNGRFDTIEYIAEPYLAGPYVEGEYAIELPVTARLIRAVNPEYRGSFEAHRQ